MINYSGSNFPEISLKYLAGIPMITSQPAAPPKPGICWYRGNSTCASRPSLPSELPYHYLLAHTALHRAVPRSVRHLSSLLQRQPLH